MTSISPASEIGATGGVAGSSGSARKPGGILVFVPIVIAAIGLAGLFLGLSPGASAARSSGYGVDEVQTGAIAAPRAAGLFR